MYKSIIMKYLLSFLLISFLTISCSDKGPAFNFQEEIQGEWKSYSFVMDCDSDSDIQSIPLTMGGEEGCIDMFGSEICTIIKIFENGVAQLKYVVDGSEVDQSELTYTLDEESQILNLCFEGENCVEYAYAENKLNNEQDEDDCICVFEYDRKD